MMRRLLLLFFIIFLMNVQKAEAQCATAINTLQYRIIDSSGYVVIQIRDTGTYIPGVTNPTPNTTMTFLGLVFGVKWPNTSSISLGTVQTYQPYGSCNLAGAPFNSGGYFRQSVGDASALLPNFNFNWVKDVWYPVFRINYSGALLTTDTFKLCVCGEDVTTDPYFSYLDNTTMDYLEYSPKIVKELKIVPTPTLTATILPSTTICGSDSITLSASTNGSTITWTNGTNNYSNGTKIIAGSSTVYTVTATNVYGGSTSTTVALTVNPVPTIGLTKTDILCNGFNSDVTVTATGGTPPILGTGLFTFPAGTFTFTVVDNNGCIDDTVVTINQPSSLNASVTTVSPRTCYNGPATVNITASGGTPPYFNTGLYTTSQDSSSVLIYDSIGCENVVTVTLPYIAPTSFNIVGPSTLYSGDTLHLYVDSNSFGGSNYQYLIDSANQIYSTTSSVHINHAVSANTGFYRFRATDSNGCLAFGNKFVTVNAAALITAKAFLQGPYNVGSGLMIDSLRSKSFIPATEPYSAISGFTQVFGGGETLSPALLSTTGANAVVDWVFLELRNGTTPATRIETKCVLITRNGDLIDPVKGSTTIAFKHAAPGSYILSLKHRNHLGVQTGTATTLGETATAFNFTNNSLTLFGSDALRLVGSVYALKAGDANKNRVIRYNGINNDRLTLLSLLGAPTNTLLGYYKEDLNMDGSVKYNGINNDRLIILSNLSGNANSTVNEQTSN